MAVILFCMPECSANQVKSFSIALWQYFSKWSVSRLLISLTSTLGTSPPSLLFKLCHGFTTEVAAQFFSSKYRSCLSQPITWLHNCVTTFAIIAVMLLCCDIMRIATRLSSSVPVQVYFSLGQGRSLGIRLSDPALWLLHEPNTWRPIALLSHTGMIFSHHCLEPVVSRIVIVDTLKLEPIAFSRLFTSSVLPIIFIVNIFFHD